MRAAFEVGLRAGDTFTLTSGVERYHLPPANAATSAGLHMFEVGPISATVVVRDGERPEDVYAKARELVEVLFQAEYDIKRANYALRLRQLEEGK